MPHVVLRTAKQRRTGRGRPTKGKSANRTVPLTDPHCVDELRRLFASTKELFEIDAETGERSPLPVWQISDRCVRNLLGHEKAESTEVYTRVFALDIVASRQVQFTLPTQEAIAMMREADASVLRP